MDCFRFKEIRDLTEATKEKDVIGALKKAQQLLSLGSVRIHDYCDGSLFVVVV